MLHDLADEFEGRVEIESLDICEPDQIAALRDRLSGRVFDMLFVNAGVTNNMDETIAEVTTEEFVRVMVTNALSPMRVIENLEGCVAATGTIGVMSSGQGSVGNNETGMREVYRGSKAALNMFMRSFAARRSGTSRAMVLMAPGWVRTEMSGPDARLTIAESVPNLVDVLLAKQEDPACNTSTISAAPSRGDAFAQNGLTGSSQDLLCETAGRSPFRSSANLRLRRILG